MTIAETYLDAARTAADLIASPLITARWDEPSALAEFAVSGLAGHLARQVIMVPGLLQRESPEEAISIFEHYARVPWLGAALDDEANVAVRRTSDAEAADGPAALAQRTAETIDTLAAVLSGPGLSGPGLPNTVLSGPGLPGTGPAKLVYLPWTGWALTLEDFLTTRLLEIVVHVDDLAVSVGSHASASEQAQDIILVLLTRLAARRHGGTAVLRALTRQERAPETIVAILPESRSYRTGRAPMRPSACAASRQPEPSASPGGFLSSHAGMNPATNASPAPVPSTTRSTGGAGTRTGGRPFA
jgi:hypothetical protein